MRLSSTGDSFTLDLLHSNVENAYLYIQPPKLDKANHNLVHLIPKYRPILKKKQRPSLVTAQQQTYNSLDQLRAGSIAQIGKCLLKLPVTWMN